MSNIQNYVNELINHTSLGEFMTIHELLAAGNLAVGTVDGKICAVFNELVLSADINYSKTSDINCAAPSHLNRAETNRIIALMQKHSIGPLNLIHHIHHHGKTSLEGKTTEGIVFALVNASGKSFSDDLSQAALSGIELFKTANDGELMTHAIALGSVTGRGIARSTYRKGHKVAFGFGRDCLVVKTKPDGTGLGMGSTVPGLAEYVRDLFESKHSFATLMDNREQVFEAIAIFHLNQVPHFSKALH